MTGILIFVALVLVAGVALGVALSSAKKESRERLTAIRRSVVVVLQRFRSSDQFDFNEVCRSRNLDENCAREVARTVYANLFNDVIRDNSDKQELYRARQLLRLTDAERHHVERELSDNYYASMWQQFDESNRPVLGELRGILAQKRRLNVSDTTASRLLALTAAPIYRNAYREWAGSSQVDREYLTLLRQALGLNDAKAADLEFKLGISIIEDEAASFITRGAMSFDEYANLVDRRNRLGISETNVQDTWIPIQRLVAINLLRSGKTLPPPIKVSIALEGGEECYLKKTCSFEWKTAKGIWKSSSGEVFITDRRLIFASMDQGRSFDTAYRDILDVEETDDGLRIRSKTAKGTGVFAQVDCEYVAALVEAVRLRAPSPENVRSRLVPKRVKEEVWARDGGRCVLCQSNLDIQYDHDIPFSKGGANTAANIRLLCAICNRKKRDRLEL